MAKIPTAANISGPASLRPSGIPALVDTSGLERGTQNLGGGIRDLGGNLGQIAERDKQRRNASDVSAAEALWTKGSLDLENRFGEDNDFATFDERAGAETEDLKTRAAELIRDPVMRERWTSETELKRIRVVDAVNDRGRALSEEQDRVSFTEALKSSAALISDPSVSDEVRNRARADILGSLQTGMQTGLISPGETQTFRTNYLDGANKTLALNRAKLQILQAPGVFSTQSGISSAMGGVDVAAAAMVTTGGVVDLDIGVASMTAEQMGDENFPDDPALQEAYLSAPDVNAQYAHAAMNMLTERYNGDVAAAVIASSPDGGTIMADAWIKNGKDDSLLPEPVRSYYRKVVENFAPEQDYANLPVIAEPGVDLSNVDAAVLDRFEKVQGIFGDQLTIISGFRDPAHNKEVGGANRSQHMERRALDIDVSNLSEEDRVRLIQTASAAGFTGIGVYKNSIHIDTGSRRAWGPDYHAESVPGWAQKVIGQHVAGEIVDVTPNMKGVADQYRDLDFDQRLQLYQADQAAVKQRGLDMQSGIQVAVQNAPAAIMQSGVYTGTMPTPEDFVKAYGGAEGINRSKAFEAEVDIAEAAHGMQTMSADDITAMVAAAKPTSTGDSAAVQGEKFAQIAKAAESTMKARAEDPAGYTMQAFPSVAEAFGAIDKGANEAEKQQAFSNALTIMANAQAELGIEKPALLPKGMATQTAATFNDVNLSQAERMGAVTGMVLATPVDAQQEAIMDQLVEAGVPSNTERAMRATARGDSGSAAYLFRAAMSDVSKLPLPANVTDKDIRDDISELVLAPGAIGSVVYRLSDGTAENFEQMQDDLALFDKAVRLRLADGSAATTDQAVRLTIDDMFGDVDPYVGGNVARVEMTIPKGQDPMPLTRGFDHLLPAVGDAIMAHLTPAMAGAATNDGTAQILTRARDDEVDRILDSGYFTNTEEGADSYMFISGRDGTYVPGPDGQPLTFTQDQVLQAGAAAGAAPFGYEGPSNPRAYTDRLKTIYGSNFGKPLPGKPY